MGPRYRPWDTRFPEAEEYLPWPSPDGFVGWSSWGCEDAQLECLGGPHGEVAVKKKTITCARNDDIPHRISLYLEGDFNAYHRAFSIVSFWVDWTLISEPCAYFDTSLLSFDLPLLPGLLPYAHLDVQNVVETNYIIDRVVRANWRQRVS